MIDHDKSNIACGINLVMGEDGAFREAPDPYAILVSDTEEDWNALQDAVNRGNRMSWISVKDRLPEDGEDVVVIARTGIPYWYHVAHLKRGRWMRDSGQRIYDTVTHWMPLPEPPKEVYHGQS